MITFGLLGYPLFNNFSKDYFNEKFKALCLSDYFYENYPLETLELLPFLIKNTPSIAGLNVTIPYKQTIFKYLDEVDMDANIVGAVNTISIKNGKLKGFNTDIYGFEHSIKPLLRPDQNKALILGTGGASKAVSFVLQKMGLEVTYVSRDKQKGIPYLEINKTLMEDNLLIVNCTPAGMYPDVDKSPLIPYEYITPEHLIYDLIYLPEETLFLKKCREKGAAIKNGLEMLYLQAEKSWEIWNGQVD